MLIIMGYYTKGVKTRTKSFFGMANGIPVNEIKQMIDSGLQVSDIC